MKRIISLILLLCMALSCVTAAGYAASAQTIDTAGTGAEQTVGDYGLAPTCEDGNILQCFNWTLDQIKQELPNIAAAGFTSVQTSPLQAHDSRNQWYWLYQPTGFTIGNELGSYEDLQSLCTQAHRYGVRIIVDVVANHVAGSNNGTLSNSVESVFKTNKSTYFHNLGAKSSDNDRYEITQKNIGMPDLNSENTAVQAMVVTMVNRLKDAGVDGIRWDAAKHIALPSEGCTFWSEMAKIDLYQYGEILDTPAGNDPDADNNALMNEYAQYVGVSDSVYSGSIMAAVRDNSIYKSEGNWNKAGVASDRIVYWAESHDTYANDASEGGWTKNLDQNKIDKAYAILGARANSQALYLSRPFETNKTSIYAAKKGSTHFTSAEVAAVNHFHNAMIGTAEKYNSTSNYYAVCREGGAVIVSKKGTDVELSVTNSSSMVPQGTYTDPISGNTWTVTDKKITGRVGSTGIAVIYDPNAAAKEIMIGDADLSGKIEIIDVNAIQRSLAGMRELSSDETAAADADESGAVSILDATAIQRYLARIKDADSKIGEKKRL